MADSMNWLKVKIILLFIRLLHLTRNIATCPVIIVFIKITIDFTKSQMILDHALNSGWRGQSYLEEAGRDRLGGTYQQC